MLVLACAVGTHRADFSTYIVETSAEAQPAQRVPEGDASCVGFNCGTMKAVDRALKIGAGVSKGQGVLIEHSPFSDESPPLFDPMLGKLDDSLENRRVAIIAIGGVVAALVGPETLSRLGGHKSDGLSLEDAGP